MVAIGSKIYVFGKSPSDNSKFALYELDIGEYYRRSTLSVAFVEAACREILAISSNRPCLTMVMPKFKMTY